VERRAACEDGAMRRLAMLALVLAAVLGGLPAQAGDDARAVLARVRGYVAWYDRQLVTVVAEERYTQTVSPTERVLYSEFGWIALPPPGETIGVREVLSVDGHTVTNAPRLQSLLRQPDSSDISREMDAILAESATWNLGAAYRNVNFPTFALAYVRRTGERDTKWRASGRGDHVDLEFEEQGHSVLVRTPDGLRSPARGRFSVDPTSGRIRQYEVRIRVPERGSLHRTTYWMLVDFAHQARLDLWVPVRMLEHHQREGEYTAASRGEATYTNYRRYETGGRLIQ